MNLKQLNQFIALAETGNFHRAAEQLHMAQPPLSISIRKLEEELGSALGLEEAEQEVDMLQAQSAADGFWDNMDKALKVQQRLKLDYQI